MMTSPRVSRPRNRSDTVRAAASTRAPSHRRMPLRAVSPRGLLLPVSSHAASAASLMLLAAGALGCSHPLHAARPLAAASAPTRGHGSAAPSAHTAQAHTAASPQAAAGAPDDGARLASHALALPGSPGPVHMDFIAFDAARGAVWIPAGNTGRLDVLDVASAQVQAIDGFPTASMQHHGHTFVVGPSSVAVGDRAVYVGNRANDQVCAIDPHTHARGACATVASMPDALALVPSRHELWVTTPRDDTIAVLHVDGTAPMSAVTTIHLGGSPECDAVDDGRGIFYTNLEDHDRTVAIDVATRQVVSSWPSGCGEDGPKGLALDASRRWLFVACPDRVESLDVGHDGRVLGSVATGGKVDAISYVADKGLLYVGSGATAMLRVVRADAHGALRVVASASTSHGARNAVVDGQGRAYLTDSLGGRIWVVEPLR